MRLVQRTRRTSGNIELGMTEHVARFRDPEAGPWHDPVLVECPRCGRCAYVASLESLATVGWYYLREARLTCPGCALTRTWAGEELHVLVDDEPAVLRYGLANWVHPDTGRAQREFRERPGIERRFGARLWLRAECCGGELLWANNAAHLDYLDAYIGATLRERPPDASSQLFWRLPGWMKDAKHREEVVRTLTRLRKRLHEANT